MFGRAPVLYQTGSPSRATGRDSLRLVMGERGHAGGPLRARRVRTGGSAGEGLGSTDVWVSGVE
jgi:hypothetical protein